jgi:TolB-like protein
MRADEDGDPNQEFFADGVGEDMITRCPNLFVIAPRGTRPHPRNLTAPPPISTSVSAIFAALAHEQPAPSRAS